MKCNCTDTVPLAIPCRHQIIIGEAPFAGKYRIMMENIATGRITEYEDATPTAKQVSFFAGRGSIDSANLFRLWVLPLNSGMFDYVPIKINGVDYQCFNVRFIKTNATDMPQNVNPLI